MASVQRNLCGSIQDVFQHNSIALMFPVRGEHLLDNARRLIPHHVHIGLRESPRRDLFVTGPIRAFDGHNASPKHLKESIVLRRLLKQGTRGGHLLNYIGIGDVEFRLSAEPIDGGNDVPSVAFMV